jgi:hypothetical protein
MKEQEIKDMVTHIHGEDSLTQEHLEKIRLLDDKYTPSYLSARAHRSKDLEDFFLN